MESQPDTSGYEVGVLAVVVGILAYAYGSVHGEDTVSCCAHGNVAFSLGTRLSVRGSSFVSPSIRLLTNRLRSGSDIPMMTEHELISTIVELAQLRKPAIYDDL